MTLRSSRVSCHPSKISRSVGIDFLATKISRSVGIVIKLRPYQPTETLTTLYYALVHSHIPYRLLVWAETYHTYLNKLRKLRNKAIRTITKSNIKNRITPQYRHLGILKLNDLYIYEIARFMDQYQWRMHWEGGFRGSNPPIDD